MDPGVSGQLSDAVGEANVTPVELEPKGAVTVMSAGHAIVGAGLTTTADAVEVLFVLSESGAAALIVAVLINGVAPPAEQDKFATTVAVCGTPGGIVGNVRLRLLEGAAAVVTFTLSMTKSCAVAVKRTRSKVAPENTTLPST